MQKFLDCTISNVILCIDYIHFNVSVEFLSSSCLPCFFPGPRRPAPNPRIPIKKVPLRRYSVVLDLNGVLVHRGGYIVGRECSVHLRPSCTAFLDWLSSRAMLSFWSSIADRNIRRVVDAVLQFTSSNREDVQVLSLRHCVLSLRHCTLIS